MSPIYKYLYYTNQILRLKDASNNNAQQYSYKNNTILVKQIQVDLDKMKIHIPEIQEIKRSVVTSV